MNFIECSSHKIPKPICNTLIKLFEDNSSLHVRGKVFGDTLKEKDSVKKCTEISLNSSFFSKEGWSIPLQTFASLLNLAAGEYLEKYSYLKTVANWGPYEGFNFQKYLPGEGFYEIHSEVPCKEVSDRMLTWMVYLNDVKNGGTYFDNQDYTSEAECGKILLWPPYWTHTHKGVVSKFETKYILTGWFVYV
jgi:hypothetical protein